MILTGSEIIEEVKLGKIEISPFSKKQINPNSYNYRIGGTLMEFIGLSDDNVPEFSKLEIPKEGFVLKPHQTYLSHTQEIIGSSKYAMSLIGRSSLGRLGLFLQISANIGHTASKHQWTLELVSAQPIRIYCNMVIGQVSFWENYGQIVEYEGVYGLKNGIQKSEFYNGKL